MLALLRSTRGAKGVSRHVQALSTISPSASSLNAGENQPDSTSVNEVTAARKRRRLASSSAECMFVYPWNGIRSSAEGLAIARGVQEKYGPAKEVILPRVRLCVSRALAATCCFHSLDTFSQDTDSVSVFHPYFWLVFDSPDVRERLPEESAQIRIRVADLPRGDGNVGVEEMVRALGLSTDKGGGAAPPFKAHPPAEGEEGSADVADAGDGYTSLDVRVEWARTFPLSIPSTR